MNSKGSFTRGFAESWIQFMILRIHVGNLESLLALYNRGVEGENYDSVGENRNPNGIAGLKGAIRDIGPSESTSESTSNCHIKEKHTYSFT